MEKLSSIERQETPVERAVRLCQEADEINKPEVTKAERDHFYELKKEFLTLTQDPYFDLDAFKAVMAGGEESQENISTFPAEPPEWYKKLFDEDYTHQKDGGIKVDEEQPEAANKNRPPLKTVA